MGLFSSRKQPRESSDRPSRPQSEQLEGQGAAIVLPEPVDVSSHQEADSVFEEAGEIQRRVSAGGTTEGVGEALVSRIEGAAVYFLRAGADGQIVFDRIIAPLSEWGLENLFIRTNVLGDADSREGVAGKRAFDLIVKLRAKYQHLSPENT